MLRVQSPSLTQPFRSNCFAVAIASLLTRPLGFPAAANRDTRGGGPRGRPAPPSVDGAGCVRPGLLAEVPPAATGEASQAVNQLASEPHLRPGAASGRS